VASQAMVNEPWEVARKGIVSSLICGDILSAKLLFSHPIARQLESSCLRSYLKASKG
jgi:hypothetical protein